MKPIFIHWDMSTGKTVATGVTGVHESYLYSATVSTVVQCGIFRRHLGPYFFASTMRTVMESAGRYRHLLDNLRKPQTHRLCTQIVTVPTMGATSHTARTFTHLLRNIFPGWVIFSCGRIIWPPLQIWRYPQLLSVSYATSSCLLSTSGNHCETGDNNSWWQRLYITGKG
jgi:hypothetical protein